MIPKKRGKLMNASDIQKNRTVCFSGHRPEKLPYGGSERCSVTRVLKSILYKTILDSIEEGYDTFITGLARGVDLWAGEIILELKAQGEKIKLVAAAPYKGHGKGFRSEEKFLLGNILLKADKTVYISETYSKGCMRMRNEYMVDHSGKLIAVISDYNSGTGATIKYAQKQGIITRIIDAKKLDEQIRRIGISNINYENFLT